MKLYILSKNIIQNLKKCLIMFKKDTLSKKKPYQECKKFPYQGNLKRV